MPTPGPTDTVNAKLTPGEVVANLGAVAIAGEEKLTKLNEEGRKLMDSVGGVEQFQKLNPEIKKQKAGIYKGMCMGGKVKGYDLGGIVDKDTSTSSLDQPEYATQGYARGGKVQGYDGTDSSMDGPISSPLNLGTDLDTTASTTIGNPITNPLPELSPLEAANNQKSLKHPTTGAPIHENSLTGGQAGAATNTKIPDVATDMPKVVNVTNSMPKVTDTTGVQSTVGNIANANSTKLGSNIVKEGNAYHSANAATNPNSANNLQAKENLFARTPKMQANPNFSKAIPASYSATGNNVPNQITQSFSQGGVVKGGIFKGFNKAQGYEDGGTVKTPIQERIDTTTGVNNVDAEKYTPMSANETYNQKANESVVNAGKERVENLKAQNAAMEKGPTYAVNDTTLPKEGWKGAVQKLKAGIFNAEPTNVMGAVTGAANQVAHNPMLVSQLNEKLKGQGLKNLIGTNPNEASPAKQAGEYLGEKAYNYFNPEAANYNPNAVKQTALPVGADLKNGAKVGDKFPAIDFSNPSINAQVTGNELKHKNLTTTNTSSTQENKGLPENAPTSMNSPLESGQGYVGGANGKQYSVTKEGIFKFDPKSKSWSKMSGPSTGAPKQSAAAQAAGTTDFWLNRNLPGGAAQWEQQQKDAAKEQQIQNLRNLALQAPNGSMDPVTFGNVKRQQHLAQQQLAALEGQEGKGYEHGLQERKLRNEEANTAAQREANLNERTYQHGMAEKGLALKEQGLAQQAALAKEQHESEAKKEANRPLKRSITLPSGENKEVIAPANEMPTQIHKAYKSDYVKKYLKANGNEPEGRNAFEGDKQKLLAGYTKAENPIQKKTYESAFENLTGLTMAEYQKMNTGE